MAKFSTIKKGALARYPFEFPMPDGTMVPVALRGLFGDDAARVLQGAREFAIARGLPEPMEDDELYVFGKRVHTILLGITNVDSPDDKPTPFFDGGIGDILTGLDDDRIILLYEAQRMFQDSIAPMTKSMDGMEYSQMVIAMALASEDARELPFERLPPVLRRSFVRTTCRQLVTLLDLKLSGGPGTPDIGTSGEKSVIGPENAN